MAETTLEPNRGESQTDAVTPGSVFDDLAAFHLRVRPGTPGPIGLGNVLAGLALAGSARTLFGSEDLLLLLAREHLIPESALPSLPGVMLLGALIGVVLSVKPALPLARWLTYLAPLVLLLVLLWAGMTGMVLFRILGDVRRWPPLLLAIGLLGACLRCLGVLMYGGGAAGAALARAAVGGLAAMGRGCARLVLPAFLFVGRIARQAHALITPIWLATWQLVVRVLCAAGGGTRGLWLAIVSWIAAVARVLVMTLRPLAKVGRKLLLALLIIVAAPLVVLGVPLVVLGVPLIAVAWVGQASFAALCRLPWQPLRRGISALGYLAYQAIASGVRASAHRLAELRLAMIGLLAVPWRALLGTIIALARVIARLLWMSVRVLARGVRSGTRAVAGVVMALVRLVALALGALAAVVILVLSYPARLLVWLIGGLAYGLTAVVVFPFRLLGMLIKLAVRPLRLVLRVAVGWLHVSAAVCWSGVRRVARRVLVSGRWVVAVGIRTGQLLAALVERLRTSDLVHAVAGRIEAVVSSTRRILALALTPLGWVWRLVAWPVQHPGEIPRLAFLDGRGSGWLGATAVVLLLFAGIRFLPATVAFGVGTGDREAAAQIAPPGAIRIVMASGGNKEEWLHPAVRAFNAASPHDAKLQLRGKPIFVEVVQETVDGRKQDYRSGTMIADTLAGRIKPTIVSPGEQSWIGRLQREWKAKHGTSLAREMGPVLVRTPLVVATWHSRARALGCWPTPEPTCTWERIHALATSTDGWGVTGYPEWGPFKLGYGYVGESNSGTLAATVMCTLGAGKIGSLTLQEVAADSGCGRFMSGIERAKVHSGVRSDWLIEQMVAGGPEYLDAIVTYELDVIHANRAWGNQLREPLVAIYPQDGTVMVGHPFTILDGSTWVSKDQAAAAVVFRAYLMSPDVQRAALELGLRPADPATLLAPPIDLAHGANPDATIVPIDLPENDVIELIVQVWRQVKKHAVIALVFDKSGSMTGSKITAAVKGAQLFVRTMDRDDRLIWIPFDTIVHLAVEGSGADVGEDLGPRIGATGAGGGTALYDAVLTAYDQIDALRRVDPSGKRYGIVILSDGRDEDSRSNLAAVETRLKPGESDPMGIQIHTIAVGNDADEEVLMKIARAGHGKFWTGQTEREMAQIYRSIATYY